jgi:hypothetical protein
MFELRQESHKFGNATVDADVLASDNGFKLIRLGTRPGVTGEWYRYASADAMLDPIADCAHWGGTITGTYNISVYWPSEGGGERQPERLEIEEIARNIDTALRAWPHAAEDEQRPIGVVYFVIRSRDTRPDYYVTCGQPLRLRQVSSFLPWRCRKVRRGVGVGSERDRFFS